MTKKDWYWVCQLSGWTVFIVLAGGWAWFRSPVFGWPQFTSLAISMGITLVVGITTTHLYRELIIRMGWLRFEIVKLIPRILLATVLFSVIFQAIYGTALNLSFGNALFPIDWEDTMSTSLSWLVLFFIWSLIYFVFHFFDNYRKEEIKNLTWEANKNEFELNKLKSQLNPHFIFNSMNSIRALVDEEPDKAKKAITQLANILRNTLLMGKKKVIPFEEEMNLVSDYLEIEQARYEERLKVSCDIHPESKHYQVPPMMIQTLVENGIKHGVSNLPQGGEIDIKTTVRNDKLYIVISNSGQYLPGRQKDQSGFGLLNTRHRLQLLYGNESSFNIYNISPEKVTTEVTIPGKTNIL